MTEFVDSFGIYALIAGLDTTASSKSLRNRWNSTGVANSIYCAPSVGPRGGPCLVMPQGAAIAKTFSHQATYITGLNVSTSSSLGIGGNPLLQFSNNGLILCTLTINLDGSIVVFGNNNPGLVLLTIPPVITSGVFAYVELSATLSGTTNMNLAVQVWVNGVSQGTGSSLLGRNMNTLTSNSATFNQLFLSSPAASSGICYAADFYLNNGTGPTNTGVFGPVQIDAYPLPNGDISVQWTPLGGTGTNFSEINENPADGDSSYVFSTTPGNVDSYAWQDVVTFTGTVKSVQLTYFARSTDEGTKTFQGNIGAGGLEQQTVTYGLPGNYRYFHQAFDLDPATGLPWTVAGFNAKQFGIKLVA